MLDCKRSLRKCRDFTREGRSRRASVPTIPPTKRPRKDGSQSDILQALSFGNIQMFWRISKVIGLKYWYFKDSRIGGRLVTGQKMEDNGETKDQTELNVDAHIINQILFVSDRDSGIVCIHNLSVSSAVLKCDLLHIKIYWTDLYYTQWVWMCRNLFFAGQREIKHYLQELHENSEATALLRRSSRKPVI